MKNALWHDMLSQLSEEHSHDSDLIDQSFSAEERVQQFIEKNLSAAALNSVRPLNDLEISITKVFIYNVKRNNEEINEKLNHLMGIYILGAMFFSWGIQFPEEEAEGRKVLACLRQLIILLSFEMGYSH